MEKLSVIYASALFDLALKQNAVDEFLSQAIFLREALSDSEVESMLDHPLIPAQKKQDFFRKAFEETLHTDLLSFLYLVADKNREKYLIPALSALISKIEQHKNIVNARVVSAVPYDTLQAETLRTMLSRKLGKRVSLDLKVDNDLIGGPYIFADGYHIDWTVKTRLKELTANLKEGCSA